MDSVQRAGLPAALTTSDDDLIAPLTQAKLCHPPTHGREVKVSTFFRYAIASSGIP
jgi:hypothetical protein